LGCHLKKQRKKKAQRIAKVNQANLLGGQVALMVKPLTFYSYLSLILIFLIPSIITYFISYSEFLFILLTSENTFFPLGMSMWGYIAGVIVFFVMIFYQKIFFDQNDYVRFFVFGFICSFFVLYFSRYVQVKQQYHTIDSLVARQDLERTFTKEFGHNYKIQVTYKRQARDEGVTPESDDQMSFLDFMIYELTKEKYAKFGRRGKYDSYHPFWSSFHFVLNLFAGSMMFIVASVWVSVSAVREKINKLFDVSREKS
jgi:hypothetical protein